MLWPFGQAKTQSPPSTSTGTGRQRSERSSSAPCYQCRPLPAAGQMSHDAPVEVQPRPHCRRRPRVMRFQKRTLQSTQHNGNATPSRKKEQFYFPSNGKPRKAAQAPTTRAVRNSPAQIFQLLTPRAQSLPPAERTPSPQPPSAPPRPEDGHGAAAMPLLAGRAPGALLAAFPRRQGGGRGPAPSAARKRWGGEGPRSRARSAARRGGMRRRRGGGGGAREGRTHRAGPARSRVPTSCALGNERAGPLRRGP